MATTEGCLSTLLSPGLGSCVSSLGEPAGHITPQLIQLSGTPTSGGVKRRLGLRVRRPRGGLRLRTLGPGNLQPQRGPSFLFTINTRPQIRSWQTSLDYCCFPRSH